MTPQETIDYNRVAEAIAYLTLHFREQPSLEDVSREVHVSPAHFQRIFAEWAGTSPRQFLRYISLQHAKTVLQDANATLFDAAFEAGLSGTGRLHGLFTGIEAMTPGEYRNGGEGLTIHTTLFTSRFGEILAAATERGICYAAFIADENDGLAQLELQFPKAQYQQGITPLLQQFIHFFNDRLETVPPLKLHVRGTPFQLQVWAALLRIPAGKITTYGHIARQIGEAGAARAVGTAIGSNPVAYLIPCHRVIQASGAIGGYMWGPERKRAIIGWEMAQMHTGNDRLR